MIFFFSPRLPTKPMVPWLPLPAVFTMPKLKYSSPNKRARVVVSQRCADLIAVVLHVPGIPATGGWHSPRAQIPFRRRSWRSELIVMPVDACVERGDRHASRRNCSLLLQYAKQVVVISHRAQIPQPACRVHADMKRSRIRRPVRRQYRHLSTGIVIKPASSSTPTLPAKQNRCDTPAAIRIAAGRCFEDRSSVGTADSVAVEILMAVETVELEPIPGIIRDQVQELAQYCSVVPVSPRIVCDDEPSEYEAVNVGQFGEQRTPSHRETSGSCRWPSVQAALQSEIGCHSAMLCRTKPSPENGFRQTGLQTRPYHVSLKTD